MSPMFGLLVAWGVLTGILIILLIYRSTLTMHEDDSIDLHEVESQMHKLTKWPRNAAHQSRQPPNSRTTSRLIA